MRIHPYISILFLILFLCQCAKKKEKTPYELYYKMDIDRKINYQIKPRTTVTIPFAYNQIYDPFLSSKKNKNNQKAGWRKSKKSTVKIVVLDSIHTKMNSQLRKQKEAKYAKAYPVIIENTARQGSVNLPLHRGCALIIQQIKTKDKGWVDIEVKTKEKLGDFYYQIKPKQYIYTKTPIYAGTDSAYLRIRLPIGDSNYFSNSYKSSIPSWIKKKSNS